MSEVLDLQPRRVLRAAVYRLYARSTMGHRGRSVLLSERMSRWDSGLEIDYRVTLGKNLVLRVTDPRSGDEAAAAHLFDAVAQLHRR